MLQVSISGSMSELARVFAFLATLPDETLIDAEATDGHAGHITKPLVTAASQPTAAGPFGNGAAAEPKMRGRKPRPEAPTAGVGGAGPFGAPAAQAQQSQEQTAMPFAAPTAAQPTTQANVPGIDAVQVAIQQMYGRGQGGMVPGLLAQFGAKTSSDVAPEKRAGFVAAAAQLG